MKDENTKAAIQLLNEVGTIVESYERVAEATGENFNIFSVLRIGTKEEQTHSRFIAELLNPKGRHGKGDAFLKLFLKKLNLEDFPTENANVQTEYYVGKVTEDTGGKIDILIQSGGHVLMIENKIYAKEQPNQLLRYSNNYKDGHLCYLTLFGDQSSQHDHLEDLEIDYERLSYENDLIGWLDLCVKEAAGNPIIRETITQYSNLVKKLTNQSIHTEMTEKIHEKILSDQNKFNAFVELQRNRNKLREKIIKGYVLVRIKSFAKENILELIDREDSLAENKNWAHFNFLSEDLDNLDLKIGFFNINKAGSKNFHFGLGWKNPKNPNIPLQENLITSFTEIFGKNPRTTKNWPCFISNEPFSNFENLETLGDIVFNPERFRDDLKEKVNKLLSVAEQAKNQL